MSEENTEPHEIPCVGCGYDVRGLDRDGCCPECGAPIARSLSGDRLANADPRWLAKIVRGQRFAAIGLLVTFFGFSGSLIAMLLGAFVAGRLGLDWQGTAGEVVRGVILVGGILGGLLIACAGFALVTSPDPRDNDREHQFSYRIVARWGVVAAIGLLTAGELGYFGSSPGLAVTGAALSCLGLIALTMALVGFFRWLARLAARIPAPEMASRTDDLATSLRWKLSIIIGALLVEEACALVPTGGSLATAANMVEAVAGCAVGLWMLGLLLSLVQIFVLMPKLARTFREIISESSMAEERTVPAGG